MTNVIIVFPKPEDGKSIKNLLVRNGFHVVALCTTGTQAAAQVDELNDGIVICSYKLPDMMYSELHDILPPGFEMLLLASQANIADHVYQDVVSLSMPLKVHDLIDTLSMMVSNAERRKRKMRAKPKERNPEEEAIIKESKRVLMERNNMSEEEAHRYLQKCSMDSGTNLVETAQMVLAMMKS